MNAAAFLDAFGESLPTSLEQFRTDIALKRGSSAAVPSSLSQMQRTLEMMIIFVVICGTASLATDVCLYGRLANLK